MGSPVTLQEQHAHILFLDSKIIPHFNSFSKSFLGDLISPLFNAFEYLPQKILFTSCLNSRSDLHILWENNHHRGNCLNVKLLRIAQLIKLYFTQIQLTAMISHHII